MALTRPSDPGMMGMPMPHPAMGMGSTVHPAMAMMGMSMPMPIPTQRRHPFAGYMGGSRSTGADLATLFAMYPGMGGNPRGLGAADIAAFLAMYQGMDPYGRRRRRCYDDLDYDYDIVFDEDSWDFDSDEDECEDPILYYTKPRRRTGRNRRRGKCHELCVDGNIADANLTLRPQTR